MKTEARDLQLCENLGQQRTEWAVTRVLWPLLYALLIAIAFGLLGQGPLARAKVEGENGALILEYKRFATAKSSTSLVVKIQGAAGQGRVLLSREYLSKVEIQKVSPEPDKMVADAEGLVYVFNTASAAPVEVRFSVEPRTVGQLKGWLALNGGEKRHFSQFIYP